MARLLRIFLNADLRNGHEGLAAMAQKEGIKIQELEPGNYLVFLNSHQNKVKLYAANDVVAYLRLPRGKIDLRTLKLIPAAFEGKGRIDYDANLKQVIDQYMPDRGPRGR